MADPVQVSQQTADAMAVMTNTNVLGAFLTITLSALGGVFALYVKTIRENKAETALWQEKFQALQERRVSEAREFITALAASASANIELKKSVEERSKSSQEQSEALREMLALTSAGQGSIKEAMGRLEMRAQENGKALQEIILTLTRRGDG